jgi:tetratricopeptide (TPR) repeat protein
MFRSLSSAGLKPARRLVSALAMSAALAGASMMAAAPAAAQEYSDAFVDTYQPVADVVNAEGGDIASVSGQFPAIVAAATTPDDRFAAGNLLLQAGNKTTNPQLQRQGLELMVASGKTPPEQIGQFQFFIGSLAFNAQDYPAARTALEAAQAAGYTAPDADIPGLIAETYFAEGNAQAGIDYVKQASERMEAAGGQVPERWLLKALQTAYSQQLVGPATEISALLVSNYPTERNWMNALQVVGALNEFEPQAQLDLLRLMRETKAMSDRSEFVRYIEAADPRIMSNEVQAVLAEGVAAGQLDASDTYYTEVKSIADQRASADQAEIGNMVAEAQSAAEPQRAIEAGDVAWSLSDFAQAEAMYQLALDKGITDRDTALTRLGMSQAKQGKYAEAQATLEQVGGARAPIAQMWSLYAQSQAG